MMTRLVGPSFVLAFVITLLVQTNSLAQSGGSLTDTCWSALGSGVSGALPWVRALIEFDGDLIAGGYFSAAGGVTSNFIARWNDSAWSPLGGGIHHLTGPGGGNRAVHALVEHEGHLWVGGSFANYDDNTHLGFIAEWDGSVWWEPICGVAYYYPRGCLNEAVYALDSFEGKLIAGGQFGHWAATWDGAEWMPMALNPPLSRVNALCVYDGQIIAAGSWGVSRWNGTAWETLSPYGSGGFNALVVYDDKLIAAGAFGSYHTVSWDGTNWSPLGSGFNRPIYVLAVYHGQLIAGGAFTMVDGVQASHIASWDGATWSPLGSGADTTVFALTVWDGKLIAGGMFTAAGNQPVNYVAQWDRPKFITVRDARNQCLSNTLFELFRVTDNAPRFDEEYLGSFVTDNYGRLVLQAVSDSTFEVMLLDGSVILRVGDRLKITRQADEQTAIRHSRFLSTMYSVHLDNADFRKNGRMVFDTVQVRDQDILLRHTEFRYDLLVSIEWDAEEIFVEGIRKDIRQMSNYLYDVTDGQLRLDTVLIYDNKVGWEEADICISASNRKWPSAGVNAIHSVSGFPVRMPRKWFGNVKDSRSFSYLLHPLGDERSTNYRTLAHEFGHYALGFYDEYLFESPKGHPTARPVPLPAGNYGMMDAQYDDLPNYGVRASEMSSEYQYEGPSSRTTRQWQYNYLSCWDNLEMWAEGDRNGFYVPILKPHQTDSTERQTQLGKDFFPGPNDDLDALDYDVGRLIQFPNPITPPAPNFRSVEVIANSVSAYGWVTVHTFQRSTGRTIEQGITTSKGEIWALGVDITQDEISASGFGFTAWVPLPKGVRRQGVDRIWLSGSAPAAGQDSVALSLNPVQGAYPMILEGNIAIGGWEYRLTIEQPFSALPQMELVTESGSQASLTLGTSSEGYFSQWPDSFATSGTATVRALDDAGASFFLSTPYLFYDVTSSGHSTELIGPGGDVTVHLDSVNTAVDRALLLSSSYPVLMSGLPSYATQVGQAHSFALPPGASLGGSNTIAIHYSESDLDLADLVRVEETSLRVHHWNSGTREWESVGGMPDTAFNLVASSITAPGVYAVFSTEQPVGVDQDEPWDEIPYRFELFQNYPNPFNPTTVVRYQVPVTSDVRLSVFDLLGREVAVLVHESKAPGSYEVSFSAKDLPSGVYLYRLSAGSFVQGRKMTLVR